MEKSPKSKRPTVGGHGFWCSCESPKSNLGDEVLEACFHEERQRAGTCRVLCHTSTGQKRNNPKVANGTWSKAPRRSGPCGERPTNLHKEFPKFRGSGTGRVKNDEPSKPDSGTEFKVHEDAVARVKVEGKEHLLWKRVPWNPCKGTEASLRRVQRSKAKRCEVCPVSPCNPGKGTNASLRLGKVRQVPSLWKYDRSSLWKVRQVQERSKEARPNQRARQTHGRCIQKGARR